MCYPSESDPVRFSIGSRPSPNCRLKYAFIALLFWMERLYAFPRERHATPATSHIAVERRGRAEDAALEVEFRRIEDGANQWGVSTCLEIVLAR
jgi:hypothetical protein